MKSHSSASRSGTLDSLRGLTLVSMIAYHTCWDLVYLYGFDWGWYRSFWAYVWQQSICCTFILLSGFCWQMGHHPLRRGLMSFLGGAALLTVPLRPLLSRIPPRLGLAVSFGLFLVLRDVNDGFLGFAGVSLLSLPQGWYANLLTAGLGFPAPGFVSSDYFSLLPWLLLFWTGFHLYRLRPENPALPDIRLPGFSVLGRHSLLIYLLHQPVVYGLLALLLHGQ